MSGLSDEILMAYADAQLDPGESARVEDLLASDPVLRERLKIFTETGPELALLFEDHLQAPIPARLKTLVSESAERRIVSLLGVRLRRAVPSTGWQKLLKRENSAFRLALASSVALIAGIGLGALLPRDTNGTGGALANLVKVKQDHLVARGPLKQLLETSPSGAVLQAGLGEAGQARLRVKLTFKDKMQDYCREYEIKRDARDGHAGIACRKAGEWQIEMQETMVLERNPGRTAPAGPSKTHQAVEAALLTLIDGDSLGKEEEGAALQARWQRR